eukprot:Selendium_serpulae@DN6391_c1_g1_i1.p1
MNAIAQFISFKKESITLTRKNSVRCLLFAYLLQQLAQATYLTLVPHHALNNLGASQHDVSNMYVGINIAQIIATLILSKIADALGRRRVVVFVFAWNCFACLLQSMATTVNFLIFARFLASIVGSPGLLVSIVMLDLSDPDSETSNMQMVGLVNGIAFLTSGLLSGAADQMGQSAERSLIRCALFCGMGWLIALLTLPETLPPEKRTALSCDFRDLRSHLGRGSKKKAVDGEILVPIVLARLLTSTAEASMGAPYAILLCRDHAASQSFFSLLLGVSGVCTVFYIIFISRCNSCKPSGVIPKIL